MINVSKPTVLDITQTPEGYSFRLERPGEPFMPMEQILEVRVSQQTVRNLCTQIGLMIGKANAGYTSSFDGHCRMLYEQLFSDRVDPRAHALREVLRTLDSPLLIKTRELRSGEPEMYWELLKYGDGDEDYLAMQADVGRSLKSQSVPPAVPRTDANFRCLFIADPNDDEPEWALPETAAEARILRSWLEEKNVDCSDFLVGKDASLTQVWDKLSSNRYDIIHFAGHVVLDLGPDEYALRMHGGELLDASSIRKANIGTPAVFLNACGSSKSQGAATNPAGSVEGLTNAFLGAGAQLAVGALFDIPDIGARLFAEKFYESVLARKPIGEAMRLARRHVRGRPNCGAAWASFVLYGDPCLKIEVRVDRLSKALQAIGLSREDFEIGGLRVVEQALGYGKGSGGVSTAHLLAAMVGGENPYLRGALEDLGVPPRALLNAFKDLFQSQGSGNGETDNLEFGYNSAEILRKAKEETAAAGRAKVAELDVVEAFARLGGGSVGEVMTKLGVDVPALAPSHAAHRRKKRRGPADGQPVPLVDRVGTLGRGDCTEEAWQVLADAAVLAAQESRPLLSTLSLLLALLRESTGPMATGLRKFGIDPLRLRKSLGIDEHVEWSPPAADAPAVTCSDNASSILNRALTLAKMSGQERVDTDDLLHALVQQGDGVAAKFLREQLGLLPEALASELFDEHGGIQADRLEPPVQRAIGKAVECAREKRHSALSRIHLLYGMLADSEGQFASFISSTGLDPAALASLLYVRLEPAGQEVDIQAQQSARCMSRSVLRLLCTAEFEAKAQGNELVTELGLVRAMLLDGCGAAGEILIAHGLNWARLKDLSVQTQARQLH